MAVLKTLVRNAKTIISIDECYPNALRSSLQQFSFIDQNQALVKTIVKLYDLLCSDSDAEKFYASYYASVVLNADSYFLPLTKPLCTILAATLGNKILAYFAKTDEQPSYTKPITAKEMDGLQYLEGYVFHAISRKIHNQKSNDTDQILLIARDVPSSTDKREFPIDDAARTGMFARPGNSAAVLSSCTYRSFDGHFRNRFTGREKTKKDGAQGYNISSNDEKEKFSQSLGKCSNDNLKPISVKVAGLKNRAESY
eukprot:gene11021-19864_t